MKTGDAVRATCDLVALVQALVGEYFNVTPDGNGDDALRGRELALRHQIAAPGSCHAR